MRESELKSERVSESEKKRVRAVKESEREEKSES